MVVRREDGYRRKGQSPHNPPLYQGLVTDGTVTSVYAEGYPY